MYQARRPSSLDLHLAQLTIIATPLCRPRPATVRPVAVAVPSSRGKPLHAGDHVVAERPWPGAWRAARSAGTSALCCCPPCGADEVPAFRASPPVRSRCSRCRRPGVACDPRGRAGRARETEAREGCPGFDAGGPHARCSEPSDHLEPCWEVTRRPGRRRTAWWSSGRPRCRGDLGCLRAVLAELRADLGQHLSAASTSTKRMSLALSRFLSRTGRK